MGQPQSPRDETTTLTVMGMSCDHCVTAVRGELSKLDGVTGVDVDLPTGRVVVTSTVPLEQAVLDAAIDEAGYEVAP